MVDTVAIVALATIGIYMLVVLALGYHGWRVGTVNVESWMAADRRLGIIVLLFTYAATWHSAFAFLGAGGFMYQNGLGFLLAAFAWLVLAGFILWLVGSRIWLLGKKYGYVTPSDLLQDFYGSRAVSLLASLVLILFTFPYVALQLSGGGIIFETATGGFVSFELGALILLLVGIIYVWLGGLRSIAWTDTVQGIFMITAVWIGALVVLGSAHQGPTAFWSAVATSFADHFVLPGPDGLLTPLWYVSWIITIAFGLTMQPHIFLRYYAAKSASTIKHVAVGGTAYLIGFFFILPIFAFTALLHFPDIANPDNALPAVLFEFTPAWFASIVVAGGVAAAMSTKDSQMHAVSILIARDWYEEFVSDVSERKETRLAQLLIPVLGGLSYLLAIMETGLLVVLLNMALEGTTQLLPLVVGALAWDRATKEGAFAGLFAGTATVAVLYLNLVSLPAFLPAALPGFWGLLLNIFLFVTVSLLTDPVSEADRDKIQGYIDYAKHRRWTEGQAAPDSPPAPASADD